MANNFAFYYGNGQRTDQQNWPPSASDLWQMPQPTCEVQNNLWMKPKLHQSSPPWAGVPTRSETWQAPSTPAVTISIQQSQRAKCTRQHWVPRPNGLAVEQHGAVPSAWIMAQAPTGVLVCLTGYSAACPRKRSQSVKPIANHLGCHSITCCFVVLNRPTLFLCRHSETELQLTSN